MSMFIMVELEVDLPPLTTPSEAERLKPHFRNVAAAGAARALRKVLPETSTVTVEPVVIQ